MTRCRMTGAVQKGVFLWGKSGRTVLNFESSAALKGMSFVPFSDINTDPKYYFHTITRVDTPRAEGRLSKPKVALFQAGA